MTRRRLRDRLHGVVVVTALVAAASAGSLGCSWLLGVSEDPLVAGEIGADAADEAETAAAALDTSPPPPVVVPDADADGAADAPGDVAVE